MPRDPWKAQAIEVFDQIEKGAHLTMRDWKAQCVALKIGLTAHPNAWTGLWRELHMAGRIKQDDSDWFLKEGLKASVGKVCVKVR